MSRYRIAILKGDGIGTDVIPAATDVLQAVAGPLAETGTELELVSLPVGLDAFDCLGSTLPDSTLAGLSGCDGALLGPVMNHAYRIGEPGMLNPSKELRKRLDLFANVRPARTPPALPTIAKGVDLVIVRENTEGFYADRNVLDGNGELRPDVDTVVSVRVVTRRASERVARAAFELARSRGGKMRVTIGHKANVLRKGCGLFLEACREVAREFPDIAVDDFHVDALAMHLVMHPQDFDVIVTTNLFGDVLSDLTAGLVGGLGMAPGLNSRTDFAVAQAVHGAAPDIAGKGVANPVAVIMSAAMLLHWLAARKAQPKLRQAAQAIEDAVGAVLREGLCLTPDLGGSSGTSQFSDAIVKALEYGPSGCSAVEAANA